VGTGFSVAEVILSKEPINYTGLEKPDALLIVTDDGWNKVKDRVAPNSKVFLDLKIKAEEKHDAKAFFKVAGKKGAALSAVSYWIKKTDIFPISALEKVVEGHKYEESLLRAINSVKDL
jgi:hypothetical protein